MLSIIFTKGSTLDIWQGSEYVFGLENYFFNIPYSFRDVIVSII